MSDDGQEEPAAIAASQGKINKPIVMPDPFHGGIEDEWEDWLNNFSACAEINGWDNKSKCMFLGVRMKGLAQKVYFELEAEVRESWSDLVVKLGSRFKNSKQEDLCKSQFLVRKRGPTESLLDFGNSVRRLSRKAYPTMDPAVRDELARDQFLRGMNHIKLSVDLRRQLPKTLDEAIRIAVEWETIEQDAETDGQRMATAQAGEATGSSHPASASAIGPDETSREMLTLMRELTQLLKNDREAGRKPFRSGGNFRGRGVRAEESSIKCWQCGQQGHRSRDCTQKECWNCGQVGHLQINCQNASKRQGN